MQLSRVVLFRSSRKQALRSYLAGRSVLCMVACSQEEGPQSLLQWESFIESHSKYQARHQTVLWSHCPQILEIVCIGHFVIYTGNHSFLAETEEVKWDFLTSLGVLLGWGPWCACRCETEIMSLYDKETADRNQSGFSLWMCLVTTASAVHMNHLWSCNNQM